MLSATERAELYRKSRSVLVRHWIDLGRLSVHLSTSTLHLSGDLLKLPSSGAELSGQAVWDLMDELRRITVGLRIDANLNNWQETSGNWMPKVDHKRELKIEESLQVNVIPDAAASN
jgi:hypothetical protein